MGNQPSKAPLIAVDTNVLIDLAAREEAAYDCISTIARRLPKAPVVVLPTVISELADISQNGDSVKERRLALTALRSIRKPWGFQPVNFVPVGHGIVEETARKIRRAGLVPDEEVNDSVIIAEAAFANATILLSSDGHLRDIDQSKLRVILDGCSFDTLIIFSPGKIARQFFDSVH